MRKWVVSNIKSLAIKRKKILRIIFCALLYCIAIVTFLWLSSDQKISFDRKDLKPIPHQIFRDRRGTILSFSLNADEERCIWSEGEKLPEQLKNAFISAEDARFYRHPGFDLQSIIRAFADNIITGEVVSGASTITQQVIRLLYPVRRSYPNKFREIIQSWKLENELSKNEILEQYLNRVPMGNQLRGVSVAALRYFGKDCNQLTLAECAILASLPKSPGYLNPYLNHHDRLFERKNWILKRMMDLGYIGASEFENAVNTVICFKTDPFPSNANHLVDMLKLKSEFNEGEIATTIDLSIQNGVENALASHKFKLYKWGAFQGAAMVVDNKSMDVLAMVGSIEFSRENQGYNNGALALRSAGSTLKPFLYAYAFEKGFTTASIIPDTEKKYISPTGVYSPDNYDKRHYGPISIRNALGNSLNITAVKMLNTLGLDEFYRRLDDLSLICDSTKTASYYGIGLAVGNLEVSLASLTAAYAALAHYGKFRPLRFTMGEKSQPPKQVMKPETAYLIYDILSDPTSRTITFGTRDLYNVPYRLALKTGTSTSYRDCWVIGYTADYTVGVWVGNFNGSPTYMLSGAGGATPILRDIMNVLYKENFPLELQRPGNIVTAKVCGLSGMKPGNWCPNINEEIFIDGTLPTQTCTQHRSDDNFRSLPPSYANWLYDKKSKGIEGSFRLADYDTDLNNLFSDSWDMAAVDSEMSSFRLLSDDAALHEQDVPPPANQHYSIGSAVSHKPSLRSSGIPTIIYPLPDDRFVIGSKDEYLTMQAQSDSPVEYLVWIINGVEHKKTPPPFITYWKPVKGENSITVLNPSGIGASVNIFVE